MVPVIDVRSSVARKIYAGELSFEFEADGQLLEIPFTRFSAPVQADLTYEIFTDNAVEVRGNITIALQGACSRCLAEAGRTFVREAEALFVPGEPRGEEYGYTGGVVRLEEFLRDTVAFALPSRLLCDACNDE